MSTSFAHLIGILHVEVSVSVIAHKHQGVLPGAYIGILGIADGLVYQHLGFFCIGYRESDLRLHPAAHG